MLAHGLKEGQKNICASIGLTRKDLLAKTIILFTFIHVIIIDQFWH